MRKLRPSEVIKVSEHQTVFYSICKKPIQTLLLPAMKGYSSLSLCVQPERQKNKKAYFLKLLYYSPRAASINDHKTGAFKRRSVFSHSLEIRSQKAMETPEENGLHASSSFWWLRKSSRRPGLEMQPPHSLVSSLLFPASPRVLSWYHSVISRWTQGPS